MSNTPTYQSLFGPDGYYTVPDARSVLSPGAYLVELLKLVDNNITTSNGAQNLQSRRPDIYTLTLDEPNTYNELSKLTIVNTLLNNNLGGTTLETASYPFNLPYDSSLEAIRLYLAQNNFSLQGLWKSVNQDTSPIPHTIYLETLGISRAQWGQYSILPTSGNLYQYYGYASGTTDNQVVTNLSTIQIFLAQTGLTQAELRELVYEDLNDPEIKDGTFQNQFFINTGSSSPISIQGQTLAYLSTTNVGNIQCFVRLAKAIGWSFTDLDWALYTIGTIVNNNTPVINDAALPYLAWIQQQVKQNGLTVNQCCGFLGNIKNFGLKSGTTFYDSIFNNPQNPPLPVVSSVSSNLTWTIIPQSGGPASSNDQQIENALSAALQLNQKDLLKVAVNISDINNLGNTLTLLTSSNPQATPQPIQPQIDLALLYRMSLLPIITGNTIDSIFSACKLLSQQNGDPSYLQNLMSTSSTPATPATPAITTTDEISDFFSWLDASPLNLGQLEFILQGSSSNPTIQNGIVSTDAVQNFIKQLNVAIEKEFLTKKKLYNQLLNSISELYITLINTDSFKELINDPIKIKKLNTDPIDYSKWIILGNSQGNPASAIYSELQKNNLINLQGIVHRLDKDYNYSLLIKQAIVDTINSIIETPSITVEEVFNSSRIGVEISEQLTNSSKTLFACLNSAYLLQQKTFAHHLSGLFHTKAAISEVLIQWGDLNLSKLLNLEEKDQPSCVLEIFASTANSFDACRDLIDKLQRAALLISVLRLSPAESSFFKTDYNVTNKYPITLNSIKQIWSFKLLVKTYSDSQNNLLRLIRNLDGQNWISSLSSICNWDVNELHFLTGSVSLNIITPSLNSILLLNTYFTTAACLGIKASALYELVQFANQGDSSTVETSYLANTLWGGLQAQLKDTPGTLTQIQNKYNEKLRNHLVPLVINTLSSQNPNPLSNYGNTPRGLYAYLLIDVEVSGVVQTSYVREAISAVQLYINRCLNQLEPESTLNQGSTLPTLWTWMQSYRMWQANMEVFLNPENYIEPELRVDKTDLFTQAEHGLKQADLTNPESIETIFGNYMNGLETIGNLQVISCAANTYTAEDAEGSQSFEELCMIGVGPAGNGQYYYRLSVFRESESQGQYVPYDWGQWQKLNITLNTVEYQPGQYGIPNPVFAFGRWYLFWVEQQKNNSINSQQSGGTNYAYYSGSIKFSHLDFNQNWVVPQCLATLDLQDTPILPVTTTNAQSGNTTVSYMISTAEDAEVIFLDLTSTQLGLKFFASYFCYQPFGIPNLINIGINCIQKLSDVTNLGGFNTLYSGNSTTFSPTNTTPPITIPFGMEIVCFGPFYQVPIYLMGTNMGLFGYNYNGGTGWAQITDFPTDVSVQSICSDASGYRWFIGTSNGLYYGKLSAFNNVASWILVSGIPSGTSVTSVYYSVETIQSNESFFAATSAGPFWSGTGNDYTSWIALGTIPFNQTNCIQFQVTAVNYGTTNGLYSFSIKDEFQGGKVLSSLNIFCLGPNISSFIFAGTDQGLYGWGYNGKEGWMQITQENNGNNAVIPPNVAVLSIVNNDIDWLFGTSNGLYYCSQATDTNTLTWNLVTDPTGFLSTQSISLIYYDGKSWYAGNSNMLYTTTTPGDFSTWVLAFSLPLVPVISSSTFPNNVYNGGPTTLSIQNEPNWFISNGYNNDQYLNISYPPGNSPTQYNVYRLNSTAIPALGALLNGNNGINQLLTPTAQQSVEALFTNLGPNTTYIPLANYPSEFIDFSNKNAMRMYYWELFFHLPFLIANELNLQQQFGKAKLWYEYIFNPLASSIPSSSGTPDPYTNDQYWCFLGLQQTNNATLATEIAQGELAELRSDLNNAVERYANASQPFDPQAIAQLRPIAYQKTMVMNYISNLLNWGDMLYTQNTTTSINEAEMLYVLAYNLLGEQPQDLGNELLTKPGPPNLNVYNWQRVNVGHVPSASSFTCVFEMNQTLYAGTNGNGLWSSIDNGNTWTQVSGLTTTYTINCINYFNNSLYAGTNGNGLWSSTDNGTKWGQVAPAPFPTEGSIAAITIINNTIYACLSLVINSNQQVSYGLWSSTDGNSWKVNPTLGGYGVNCIQSTSAGLFAGTGDHGLWLSTDQGTSWTQVSSLTTTYTINCINYFNNSLYTGTNGNGLWSSTDNGITWTLVINNTYFPTKGSIAAITIINNTIYACLSFERSNVSYLSYGLWYSTDGNNWVLDPAFGVDSINCIQSTSAGIFAGTSNGLYLLPYQFGIPRNQQFLSYWTEVQQRIYNIRNGLTITGQTDNLPLFAPPINPMALVEAVASGESVEQLLQLQNPLIPYYRFDTMIEKSKEFTATVVQLGQSILAALQAQDAQTLAELYNTNNGNILNLTQAAKQDSLNASQQTLQALQAGLTSAQNRLTYYNQLITEGLSPHEVMQVGLSSTALTVQNVVNDIRIAASIAYGIPTIFGFSDGGFHPGNMISEGATQAEGMGNLFNQHSNLVGTNAGFTRRAQDWSFQATLAQDDINQINYQILSAQYQVDLAQQELNLLQTQITQQQQVAAFYTSKFTNDQLYSWYTGQLSSLYFQAYHLAHDMALQAENAWNFEHIGLPFLNQQSSFIQPGYWNSLYQGLLCGASLQLDLLRMEKAYMDQNVRRLEITKTISLSRLDPVALQTLIQTGSCQFELTENDFAWDYPGHYCRKVKTVSVSIPMVVGPYQDLHATLTQTANRIINSDAPDGINAVKYLLNPSKNPLSGTNTALQTNLIPNQQIALSQGVNDTGMFELNFNDARYLPFEGTGAVSSWQLDLPKDTNFINYESISDVIIQMRYTALPASSAYTQAVTQARADFSGYQTISLAQQFPNASNSLIESGTSSMQFTVTASKWLGVSTATTITITSILICAAIGNLASDLKLTLENVSSDATTVTFSPWPANNLISQGDIPSGGIPGFPTSAQNIQLSLENRSDLSLSGLQNLVLIIEYSVS